MNYSLTVEDRQTYLHFRVTGTNSVEVVRRYMFEIYTACVERRCSTILIEENLDGPGLGLTDIYNVVAEGSQRKSMPVLRVAYVDLNPAHSATNLEFARTVALNRGLEVMVFATVAEAEQWLDSATISAPRRAE